MNKKHKYVVKYFGQLTDAIASFPYMMCVKSLLQISDETEGDAVMEWNEIE